MNFGVGLEKMLQHGAFPAKIGVDRAVILIF
jgi:hypothetical protein